MSENEADEPPALAENGALPIKEEPDPDTKRGKLVRNVRDALAALPVHFSSQTEPLARHQRMLEEISKHVDKLTRP